MQFDQIDAVRVLGILCGLAFIPHSLAKFTARDAVAQVFEKSGFRPVKLFMALALLIEVAATICLVAGIFVRPMAAAAAIFMLSAGLAAYRISGGKWNWVLGGCEFHVFWAVCLIIVAIWG